MQPFAGIVLAVMSAAGYAALVVGIGALLARRWKDGLKRLALGVLVLFLAAASLAVLAKALISGDLWTSDVGPEVKARALAENISALMNSFALGMPAGVVAGGLLVWRERRKRRA